MKHDTLSKHKATNILKGSHIFYSRLIIYDTLFKHKAINILKGSLYCYDKQKSRYWRFAFTIFNIKIINNKIKLFTNYCKA